MQLPNEKIGCHRTGFVKKCRKLVVAGHCERWVQVQGKNANTGEEISSFNCIDNWSFLLSLEQAKLQHQTGAAIESFRNEMVRANAEAISHNGAVQHALSLMPATGNPVRLLEGSSDAQD
jgi:hypothetical protein